MSSSSTVMRGNRATKPSKDDAATPIGFINLLKYELRKAVNMRSRYKKQGRPDEAKRWDARINQLRQFLTQFTEDRRVFIENYPCGRMKIPDIPPFDAETLKFEIPPELPARCNAPVRLARKNAKRAEKRGDVQAQMKWLDILKRERSWLQKARIRARCGERQERWFPPPGYVKRGRPKGPRRPPVKRVRNPNPQPMGRPPKKLYRESAQESTEEPVQCVQRLTEEQARNLAMYSNPPTPYSSGDEW
jgi:hypothetical protein